MLKITDNLEIIRRLDKFSASHAYINDLQELADNVESVLDDLLMIEFSGLYLYDFVAKTFKLLVAKGFTEEEKTEAEKTAMERHPGYVFRTRQIVDIPDTEDENYFRSISSPRSFSIKSRLFMPVLNGDQPVGAFGIVSSRKNEFSEVHKVILSFICNIAGVIYGNMVNQAELRKTSLIAMETDNAVIITDSDGKTEWVNKSFERITGYSFDEIRGKRPGEILQGELTDKQAVRRIAEAIQSGQPIECDLVNYHKNGNPYWVRLQIQPILGKAGKLTNFISIQRDITEQKKAHDQLQSLSVRLSTLIKNLNAGILVEDQARKIVLLNQAFCDMFGIPANPSALIGMDCTNSAEDAKHLFLRPDEFTTRIRYLLSERQTSLNEVLELADGRVFERDYIPILLDDLYLGNLWQYRDVSGRKRIEADLLRAKQEAEAANAAKSLFLANMSHEIRTPLNAVIGLSRILRSTSLDEEQQKLNDNLLVSGENLLGIINEILDFSKIEAGKIELEKIPFRISEIIDSVHRFLAHVADDKGIVLTIEAGPGSDIPMVGDPLRVQQVIVNLVNNAIKFTSEGGVTLSCTPGAGKNGTVAFTISVRDTGIGISEKNQKAIFEKFTQEEGSVTRRYGGTGLGLSISRQLVELMGGTLQLESKKGEGSRFFFTLEFPSTDEKTLMGTRRNIVIDSTILHGKCILVVEDNNINRFIARSILEKWNATVILAENGREAIEKVRERMVDLILMDMQMPVMDGLEATRIIREELKLTVPVIALTAYATHEAIEISKRSGMDDYLTKPFEETALYEKILMRLGLSISYTQPELNHRHHKEHTDKHNQPHFDLDKLSKLLGNDETEILGMIEQFIELTPEYCRPLYDAAGDLNLEAISHAAHRVKSSIDLFASGNLRNNIRMIHDYAKNREHTERLPKLLDYFRQTMPVMIRQLEEKADLLRINIQN